MPDRPWPSCASSFLRFYGENLCPHRKKGAINPSADSFASPLKNILAGTGFRFTINHSETQPVRQCQRYA